VRLENDYLCNIVCKNDPDDSKKARVFYAENWGVLSSDISAYGENGLYRGETIFSFRTITGCMIRMLSCYTGKFRMPPDHEKLLGVVCDADDLDDQSKNTFKRFYCIRHSLANFMPLPRAERRYNLNAIKGSATCKYHDFPNVFFDDIRKSLSSDNNAAPAFSKHDSNKKYFEHFHCWPSYVEKNYLQDFFDDPSYSTFIQTAPPPNLPYKQHLASCLSDDERTCNKRFVLKYINQAICIIEKRAGRLASLYNSRYCHTPPTPTSDLDS
jgi:hypothetical protein